jgi:hypothetical protein
MRSRLGLREYGRRAAKATIPSQVVSASTMTTQNHDSNSSSGHANLLGLVVRILYPG